MGDFLKICMVSPEFSPFAKTGGLGDCVASLSKCIAQLGHDVKVILPKYASLSLPEGIIEHIKPLPIHMGYGVEYGKIWEFKQDHLSIYFVEFDRYFKRDGIYTGSYGDYMDNHERFAFLSRTAIDLCYGLDWIPDIIHGHDWTTGLIPVILDTIERHRPMGQCRSVFTIHNLQHHGYAPSSVLDFLGIPSHVFRPDGVEALGQVNMMKAGLYFASKLTTVSETYAREIQTQEFGFGLDPVLKFRAGDLIGIRNGIDESLWSPETDPLLPVKFSTQNMRGKSICKKKLQIYSNFSIDHNIPILGVVSRLYEQKGLDILAHILPDLFENLAIQFVLLGNGDRELESRFIQIAKKYHKQCFVYIGFQEALSHLIEAGSDFFVMPSRFEPCGLNQMYSMRYGTLPIAHATGGLKDTIQSYEEFENTPDHEFTIDDLESRNIDQKSTSTIRQLESSIKITSSSSFFKEQVRLKPTHDSGKDQMQENTFYRQKKQKQTSSDHSNHKTSNVELLLKNCTIHKMICPESRIASKSLTKRRPKKYSTGTGFLFEELTHSTLYDTIARACSIYRQHPEVIKAMRQRAMQQDFSWNASAPKYIDVYRWARKSSFDGLT